MKRMMGVAVCLGLALAAALPAVSRADFEDCDGSVQFLGRQIRNGGSYYFDMPLDQLIDAVRGLGADSIQILSSTSFRASAGNCYATFSGLPASGSSDIGDVDSDDADEGQAAVASSRVAANKVIRQSIFTQAKPRTQARKAAKPAPAQTPSQPAPQESGLPGLPGFGRAHFGAADVFYNQWEVGEAEGSTFGLNPSATWGERDELTVTLPLHITSPDGGDTIFGAGIDGAFRHPFAGKLEALSAGVHAYGMGFFGDESGSAFGGGPFLSLTKRIERWILSAGALVEFTEPDEGDSVTELVPAVNVGYDITDDVAVNAYAIHFKNLDSDVDDDAYTDIGGDVQWVKGTWSLSGGLRVTTGLEDVESTEVYLGSNWIF